MLSRNDDLRASQSLIRVLLAHHRALVLARSDKAILQEYASLLRSLRNRAPRSTEGFKGPQLPKTTERGAPLRYNDDEIRNASLLELEAMVSDPLASRRLLERIAILRFSVPRGSMRSFSSKGMLVDKLQTLISNERAHETIGAVARDQVKRE